MTHGLAPLQRRRAGLVLAASKAAKNHRGQGDTAAKLRAATVALLKAEVAARVSAKAPSRKRKPPGGTADLFSMEMSHAR